MPDIDKPPDMADIRSQPDAPNYGRVWRLVPLREEQRLWTWACSKAGEKLIPFMFSAILERCRWVVAERVKRGARVEQWVIETIDRLSRR